MGVRGLVRGGEDQVTAALQGDEVALEAVIGVWLPVVYAWCARLGAAGGVDAEEAAHDVMMLLVRRCDTIDGPRRLPAWLFATARRVVANHRRRAWWRRWLPGIALDTRPTPTGTGDALDERDLADRVARALETLSTDHREVLVLCYLDDRSVAEASEILGIPAGTVKSRLFAARARFHDVFPEDER